MFESCGFCFISLQFFMEVKGAASSQSCLLVFQFLMLTYMAQCTVFRSLAIMNKATFFKANFNYIMK